MSRSTWHRLAPPPRSASRVRPDACSIVLPGRARRDRRRSASKPFVCSAMKSRSSTPAAPRVVAASSDGLHDALQRRGVAADLDLIVGRGDRRSSRSVSHLDRVLRDRRSAPAPRSRSGLNTMIGTPRRDARAACAIMRGWLVPGIVPHAKISVAMVEILQRHRALADADRLRQADAGRLVAHVRAVGEVVGAEFAHEELVEERRLVATRGPRCRTPPCRDRAARCSAPPIAANASSHAIGT